MDPNKRGNPPFEPSSYAAGLERRLKREVEWRNKAIDMARTLIDASFEEQGLAADWWREQFNPVEVVLSAPPLPRRTFMNDVVEREADGDARSTFAVSVLLWKNDGRQIETTLTLSHSSNTTREEAVVRGLEYARKVRPGFSIVEWLAADVLNAVPAALADASQPSPEPAQ